MKYMLDTNICFYLIKQQPREVIDIFQGTAPGEIALSSVTVAKMMYGWEKASIRKRTNLLSNLF